MRPYVGMKWMVDQQAITVGLAYFVLNGLFKLNILN